MKAAGSSAKPEDGSRITHGIAWELQVAEMARRLAVKGPKGDRGPAGPAGPAGKDGVLQLPVSVEIHGQVTSLGAGE